MQGSHGRWETIRGGRNIEKERRQMVEKRETCTEGNGGKRGRNGGRRKVRRGRVGRWRDIEGRKVIKGER